MIQEKAEEILEDSPEGQRLRFLENEIHKTNLKLMEGETIKKKYMTILDMLKKERLTFGNQIEGLEAQLRKQEEEIEKLKVRTVYCNSKDITMLHLIYDTIFPHVSRKIFIVLFQ